MGVSLMSHVPNETVARYIIYIITVEDGCVEGGFGSAIAEFACENCFAARVERVGVPDKFVEQGSIAQLQKLCKMDSESIAEKAIAMLED